MADALVLGTNVFDVWVRVPPRSPIPFFLPVVGEISYQLYEVVVQW